MLDRGGFAVGIYTTDLTVNTKSWLRYFGIKMLPVRTTLNHAWPPNWLGSALFPRERPPRTPRTPRDPDNISPTLTPSLFPHDHTRVTYTLISRLQTYSAAQKASASLGADFIQLSGQARSSRRPGRDSDPAAPSARYFSCNTDGSPSHLAPRITHAPLSCLAFFQPPTCLVSSRRGGLRRRWMRVTQAVNCSIGRTRSWRWTVWTLGSVSLPTI